MNMHMQRELEKLKKMILALSAGGGAEGGVVAGEA